MLSTMTITSDHARLNWRDTINNATSGKEVVIERYNKPTATLVSFEVWNTMKRKLQEMESLLLHYQRRAEMEADPTMIMTGEELAKMLNDEGLVD